MLQPGILRGVAFVGQGAVEEAIARIREGVTNWTQLGRTIFLPYGLAFLAEGLARHGDRAAALAALREGLETACATGEHGWDVELHRLTGTVLLAENKLDEGQASLQQAIRAEPWADTGTSTGRLMIAVLGGLADVERDLIRTRTAEGRSRAQKRGQRMGRKPKLTEAQQAEARKRRRKVQRSPNSRAATVWERVRFPGSQPDLDFVKLIPTFHQFCNFFL